VLGVYISAKTRVHDAVAVNDKILANVEGYVRKYEILGEKEEGAVHKTRIRALVLYRKLGDDLKAAGLVPPPPPPGNPRVAVFVRDQGNGEKWGNDSSAAVRRALLERNFSVVDLNDSAVDSGPARSSSTAASLGLKLGADLVLLGDVQVHPLEGAPMEGFHSYRARLHVLAVKPAMGQVVAEKTQEASAIDPAADIAASKSADAAGQLLGEALAADLAAGLKSRVGVAVKVAGLGGLADL